MLRLVMEGEEKHSGHVKTGKHDRRLQRFLEAGLYLVTSQEVSRGRKTLEIVRSALSGGVRLVQLREKSLNDDEFLDLARAVREITADSQALLIINDKVNVALAVDADGVHLGQEDIAVNVARRKAPDLIIGASCHSISEAREAEENGASYINIGPLFPTGTKEWKGSFLGLAGMRTISNGISLPFTVMGGIKKKHIGALVAEGATTIAVVTAVTAADDPAAAARDLMAEIAVAASKRDRRE